MSKDKGAKKPAKKARDSAEGFSRTKTIGNDPIIRVQDLEIDTNSEHVAGYVVWGITAAKSAELKAYAAVADTSGPALKGIHDHDTDGIDGKRWQGQLEAISASNGLFTFSIKCVPLKANKVLDLVLVLISRNAAGAVVNYDIEMVTLYV